MHFTEKGKFLIVGHRGLPSVKPENTLESFRSAFSAGADAVELDVQLSKDLIPVVYHDFDMKRLHGSACRIEDTSYDEILRISYAKGTPVPKLEDLFVDLPSGTFFIELKTIDEDGRISKRDPADKVVELIRKYRMKDSVVVISFSPESLRLTMNADPEIKTGLDYDSGTIKILGNSLFRDTIYEKEINFLLPDFNVINFSGDSQNRNKFKKMIPWTVDEIVLLLKIHAAKMKGVITNRCDEFARFLNQKT